MGLLYYVEDAILSLKGIEAICDAFREIKNILAYLAIDRIYAFASLPFNSLTNANVVINQIQDAVGISIDVLTGEEEAWFVFRGTTQSNAISSGIPADIRGGSTALVQVENNLMKKSVSVPIGSLSLSLKYVKGVSIHKSNILDIKQELRRELKRTKLFESDEPMKLYASGGTARALLRLYNDIYGFSCDNTKLEEQKFNGILVKYNEERRDILKRIKQLAPDRLHTLIPGMLELQIIAAFCRSESIKVNPYGVSEGVLMGRVLTGDVHISPAESLKHLADTQHLIS